MKEFYAYKNKDGTYRLEGVGYVVENGITKEVRVEIPCAQLTIDPFFSKEGENATYLFKIKEN